VVRAYVFSIGSELLQGHLTDTNATFLAQELTSVGIDLLHVIQCGDRFQRLTRQLAIARDDADLVICTGGIGPTEDDLTREAIAAVVEEVPAIDEVLLAQIEEFFRARGLTMPERNRKQAWIIPSSEVLPNPIGTAPGWFVAKEGVIFIAMPGVPREMKRMWSEQALPRLLDCMSRDAFSSVTLKTIGIGESALEDRLSDLVGERNPIVATYAKDEGVHIRVTGIAQSEDEAESLRDDATAAIRRRVGQYIYANDGGTLPGVLADALRDRGLRLSIVDQGGGGQFAAFMLSDPSSASVVAGSQATPADIDNAATLADRARGVSAEVLGIGVTVAAESSPHSVAGRIEVAVSDPLRTVEQFNVRSSFVEIQRRTVLTAADVLYRALKLDQSG
jgi:nicotinamide-nucleotide amidase